MVSVVTSDFIEIHCTNRVSTYFIKIEAKRIMLCNIKIESISVNPLAPNEIYMYVVPHSKPPEAAF